MENLGFQLFCSTFQSWRQHKLSPADGEKIFVIEYWILYYFNIRSKSGEQIIGKFPGIPLTLKRGSAKLCRGSWLNFARFRDPRWLWLVPIVVMGSECPGWLWSCVFLVMAFGCLCPCVENLRPCPSWVYDCLSFVWVLALVRFVLQNCVRIDSVTKCSGHGHAVVCWAWLCS